MANLEHKKEAVLRSVRSYLQNAENKVQEKVAGTGTVYFTTNPCGVFCGKRIRVSNHATHDDSVLISLRYDLIGSNVSLDSIKKRVYRTLDNSARRQSARRVGWLLSNI